MILNYILNISLLGFFLSLSSCVIKRGDRSIVSDGLDKCVFLSSFVHPEKKWSVSLLAEERDRRLVFAVRGFDSMSELVVRSRVYEVDGCELSIDEGRGVVLYVRPDGGALVIDEAAGASVQESSLVYIVFDEFGVPTRKNYDLANPELLDSLPKSGVTLQEVFQGWSEDGRPLIFLESSVG